ncbi:hypothetical protein QNM97_23715 [Gordonia sp. L191]|uniref:hypothetical protein n=1 Tax=Gordonia sp. L191 TaxID=2982699 RepID=UPI0024BFDFC2|nr:hypothetical protein [Gordonia sp. L191]WHU46927.1 hypothetical protein QNM97_23715 [Gordonia sp. L191]
MKFTHGSEIDGLRRAALEVTRNWSSNKVAMALRATGLDTGREGRETLDAIAADLGVSRETVRRARKDLLRMMDLPAGSASNSVSSSPTLRAPREPSADSPATARAVRRLLTMTGPLPYDEVLNAWARAGGKPPYSPLPDDIDAFRDWANDVGGLTVSARSGAGEPPIVGAVLPEDLDQVGRFLSRALANEPGGVDREVLLDSAEEAGLKPTTVATALSMHPAVTRVSRGRWALRGRRPAEVDEHVRVTEPRRTARSRPTSFAWSADGSLQIEFSVPRGPSPVIAVPRAVSEIVEGREFSVASVTKSTRVTVRNARIWGFGPLLTELGVSVGTRVTLALNVLVGTAAIMTTEGEGTSS